MVRSHPPAPENRSDGGDPHRVGGGWIAALVVAIACWWVGSLALWCVLHAPPAAHDDANLYLWAVDLEAWWAAGAKGGVPPNVRGAPYPPLLPLLAGLAFHLLGARSVGLAEAVGAPAVGLLSAAAGWMAATLLPPRGRAWGALAAAAIAPLPLWSLGHPGSNHVDLPLGALGGAAACAAVVVLHRGERGAAVATGALAALALGVKWTAAFFLAPVLLVGLWRRPARAGLALAIAAALCGPWYLAELPRLVEFLGRNLGGEYTGDRAPLALAAWFYPSRLLHGVVGLPLLACAAAGLRAAGPHRVSALALAVGGWLLTLQPYRDERYLLAALGLLAPILVVGAWRLGRRAALVALVAVGLAFSVSWLVPGAPQGSLVVHRDGLRVAGLRAARRDLLVPPVRWKGAAPDPLAPPGALRLAARALHRLAPPGPLAVHVVDLVGRSVLERTRVELATVRGSGVQLSRPIAREGALAEQVRRGRTEAWSAPRPLANRAWIVESLRVEDLEAARPAWARLRAEGRRVVYRGGALTGDRPAVVQIWGPPGR